MAENTKIDFNFTDLPANPFVWNGNTNSLYKSISDTIGTGYFSFHSCNKKDHSTCTNMKNRIRYYLEHVNNPQENNYYNYKINNNNI